MAPAVNRAQPPTSDEVAVHRRLMRFGEAESLATPMWEEPATSVRAIASHLASLWDVPVGYDDGAIDEGDLSAFTLVFEQFHHAVADRRVALEDMPQDLARLRSRQ